MTMQTKCIIWHEPTDSHFVVDSMEQIADVVARVLQLPENMPVQVIPKEFYIFPNVPYFGVGHD